MAPEHLEAHLAGHPDSATVAAVVAALRADPDWSVTELTLENRPEVIEMLHHPSGTAYTLSRRSSRALQGAEGSI